MENSNNLINSILTIILTKLSGKSPSEREGMKVNLSVSQTDVIPVRWQTEVKVVG